MEKNKLVELEHRCIQEQPPYCSAACPIHVDVRAMMAETARGNLAEAARIFRKTVPFPGIVSRVCDQPCRPVCRRNEAGEPLAVVAIEKSCLDYAAERSEKITVLPKKETWVGIVGGGLSGLTAAFDLARKGYRVVVFEKGRHLGGSLWSFPGRKTSWKDHWRRPAGPGEGRGGDSVEHHRGERYLLRCPLRGF